MMHQPHASRWEWRRTKSCCSMSGVWLKKKIPKRCFEHLSFSVCETGINFICWLSAMDRSDTQYKNCDSPAVAGETFHGFRTALILLISPVIIAQRICLFTQVSRKHLVLLRWRARRAELRWSEFAAVTWTGLFAMTRNRGQARTLRKRWPARLKQQAQRSCRAWASAPPARRRIFIAGRACLTNCFAFIARFA